MIITNEDELVFVANEDLFNQSKTQILIYKNTPKTLKISQKRKLISYCWEYCGITGLSYQTLRFQNIGRDIKPDTIVSSSFHLSVIHKAEFSLEPPNSLKSSLKGILVNSTYSDLTILYGDKKKIEAHKCMLSCRSTRFDEVIDKLEPKKNNKLDLRKTINDTKKEKAFEQLINFIYSSEIVFPEDPEEVFDLIKLADEYRIKDLQQMCEEDIINKLDSENVMKFLFLFEESKIVGESTLIKCRGLFIKNFEGIANKFEDIEEKMCTVPGLIKNLLLQVSSKKKLKRKVTFMNYEV